MRSNFFSLRRLARLPMLACLLLMALSCAKEPTPEENASTPAEFTPEKFAAVQIGQDWTTVMQSLGKPHGFYDVGQGRKRYAFSVAKDRTKKYMAYDIVVGTDGKVCDKSRFSLYEE